MFWPVRKRAFGNGRSTYDGSSGEPGQVLSAISEPLVVPLTDSTAKPGIVAWLSISHSARSRSWAGSAVRLNRNWTRWFFDPAYLSADRAGGSSSPGSARAFRRCNRTP